MSQTVPLPASVGEGLAAFAASGGRLIADNSTTCLLPPCTRVDLVIPVRYTPGKVYNWPCPNTPPGKKRHVRLGRHPP